MIQPNISIFGPSSGTTTVGTIILDEGNRIIKLENMSLSFDILIGPGQVVSDRGSGRMPKSIASSFERSLAENKSLWEELSRL